MGGKCGSCTMCCRVLGIREIKKKPNAWCPHCAVGSGCKIYEERPPSCIEFECIWLQSQDRENPKQRLPASLRPDRCKVVLSMSTNETVVSASVDLGFPAAWRKPEIYSVIGQFARGGIHIVVGWSESTNKILISRHPVTDDLVEKPIVMTEPDENGMQWANVK